MMETMFYHVTLDNRTVINIADLNAAVNACLGQGLIDRNKAYAFSSVSAQLLDITVIDKDLYKQTYARSIETKTRDLSRNESIARKLCSGGEDKLPEITKKFAEEYMNISQRVAAGRAQERREMAQMMSSFGSNWSQPSYNFVSYSPPPVGFLGTQPKNINIMTSGGDVINCRATNKNFVYCF